MEIIAAGTKGFFHDNSARAGADKEGPPAAAAHRTGWSVTHCAEECLYV
jgi:hypothetical protein